MKKRLVALLAVSSMMVGLLAGCGENSNTSNGTESENVTLSMLLCEDSTAPYSEDWEVLKAIEKASGVTFDVQTVPASDWATKRTVVINSGKAPDIISHSTDIDITTELSGALLPISEYVDEMPHFKEYIESHGYEQYLDNIRLADGNYYMFPTKMSSMVIEDRQWMIRKDILEKNNLEIPTTMDELKDVAKKLKEIYPDSTPIGNRFTDGNIDSGVARAYGTVAGWEYGQGMFYDETAKEWEFAPITDNWKDFATTMNELYTSGALDEEYATLENEIFQQNVVNDKIFIAYDWPEWCNTFNNIAKENGNEEFEMVPMMAPTGYEGNYAIGSRYPWTQAYIFPATVKDKPYFKQLLQYLDWCYTPEAASIQTFGTEGVSYEVKDNQKVLLECDRGDCVKKYGIVDNNFQVLYDDDWYKSPTTAENVAEIYKETVEKNAIPKAVPASPLTSEQLDEASVMINTLKDYTSSSIQQFINGSMPLSDWDSYVQNCKDKGCDKLVDLYNGKE